MPLSLTGFSVTLFFFPCVAFPAARHHGIAGAHQKTSKWVFGRAGHLLNIWKAGSGCIVEIHFFWGYSTRLQKSINGLLGSLVDETSRQMPDLIDSIVPEASFQNEYSSQSGEDCQNRSIFVL
ncbi:hypothetical protein LX32DRAFT_648155 [Colletotrichum zoysiae]|uniref:Secreted protein n=1 Tax=Colletotrichum zoysiae TaxID=1216348 RepID=A0AAD9HVJ4_9PEZI|nr:hypothetical protein LX32DRAFT_648155 [Colletotrichum zoysiae]